MVANRVTPRQRAKPAVRPKARSHGSSSRGGSRRSPTRRLPAKRLNALDVRTRAHWREWLQLHHRSESEVWLVFHKRHTGAASVDYEDAVEEALCFGWIDSLVRRLDDDRYARKFTPRTAGSHWSALNRRRYAAVAARGLLAPAGIARAPTGRSAVAPTRSVRALPAYIERALEANARARRYFEQLAPSYRRLYIGWIDSAKREETKAKRLAEAIRLLAAGKKLGLK
jgi:uncharacterized protein YdeI (YjbR/CyaY-like superfamily)